MNINIPGQTLMLEEFKINTLIYDDNNEFNLLSHLWFQSIDDWLGCV